MAGPRICVAPRGARSWVGEAVVAGGGQVVDPDEAEAVVWTSPTDPDGLAALLADHPGLRWVQLPFAGIEPYRDVLDAERTWTCGKGVYAPPVAELALTLLLAGLRHVGPYARAGRWTGPAGRNLLGARLAVLGGGGITEELLRLLAPFDVDATVVRRHPDPVAGAARVVGPDGLHGALAGADGVVLALALTPETRGVVGAEELALLADHACVVNVARGGHVDTDALVAAFAADTIGSAGLDVTDPEPLPEDHPLWAEPRCTITPHVGNTPDMAVPLLSARIRENVGRWAAGRDLLGPVDVALGY
ncbi:NAD(P)-dependent oxidoreductase [Iamia majanohamensis]|uniref:NAD(P)-dependent oxidoreductase n=1 Tax=Iamia majanohamensis TaxID=467976 RepID=A0AAF0BSP9_9ACTN|nr:NAD(P)-dependent oxidoreductase [Iamia majanohamensis]WCO68676.1 NAD(P)-dependent oxidoreductase [Iamia majanohamensis]